MKAKERIEWIFDKDSIDYERYLDKSGFLFGSGKIDERKVYFITFANDEKAESLFEDFASLDRFFQDIIKAPAPLILMMDIPSHHQSSQQSPFPDDAQKLLASRFGVGKWYYNHARLSGKIPQIALVFNKMGAALTFPIALCDISLMLNDAGMSIGRLDVVESVLHQNLSYDSLGGAMIHAKLSGSVDCVVSDETALLSKAKEYLSYLPQKSTDDLPKHKFTYSSNPDSVAELIPISVHIPLDMDALIKVVCDDNSFVELRSEFAKEIITGFATFGGKISGVIANRSKVNGGILFPHTLQKTSRFISLCDAYGIPIVFLSDSAGFMIGQDVEKGGNIKYGAQLFATISNATTAKLSVSVRRNYTAGVYAMGGGGMMSDRFIALDTSVISIYGDSVAKTLLEKSTDSTNANQNAHDMLNSAKEPQMFLDMGLIDALIKPKELRDEILSFVAQHQDGSRASQKMITIM